MGVTLFKDANTCSAVFLPEQMRRGSFQIVVSVLGGFHMPARNASCNLKGGLTTA